MKKQMKKIAFALFAVSCLMLTTVSENSMSYAAEKDKDETSREVSKVFKDEEIKATAKLLTAANYFKRIFLTDYEKALLIFSEDKVIKQFKTLNKEIWVDTPPELGWSLFMSASVHVAGGVEGRTPIVGFYYPYGDVFLMTEWNMNEEIPKITDVEVVMGDFIRTETKELTAIPHWLRTKMFKPFALGDSVAKSIAAFEKLFGTEPVSNWRKKLPVLKKKEVLSEVNYPASALMIFNTLRNIDDFRAANKEINPRLAACREMTIKTVRSAANQELDKLFDEADKTLPETKKALKGLRPEWFRTLEAVAVLEAQDGCLVFLSPVFDASGVLTLLFIGEKTELSLSRIDVVDYSGFYNMAKKQKENKDIEDGEGIEIEGGAK